VAVTSHRHITPAPAPAPALALALLALTLHPSPSHAQAEAVILHGNNSYDSAASWHGLLASLGVEYDNIDNAYVRDGKLLDAGLNLRHRLFICKGGYASEHASLLGPKGKNGKSGFANLRNFVRLGGHYTGSCSGAYLATLQENDGAYSGAGIIGMKSDGSQGTRPLYNYHGTIANPSRMDVKLVATHPICKGATDRPSGAYFGPANELRGVNIYGGMVWVYGGGRAPWSSRFRRVGLVERYVQADKGRKGYTSVLEDAPHSLGGNYKFFGRVVVNSDHPEHRAQSYWFARQILRYLLWGPSRTDPSGNRPPSGRMTLDRAVVWSGDKVTARALGVKDPDGHQVKVLWDNATGPFALTWEGKGATYTFGPTETVSGPRRVKMRLVDSGKTRRIFEQTRLLAVNAGKDPDGKLVDFSLKASAVSGTAPLHVTFTAARTGGDKVYPGSKTSTWSYWDAGNGLARNLGGWTYDAVYFRPGRYQASLAVRDDDGHWNVKTVAVDVKGPKPPPVDAGPPPPDGAKPDRPPAPADRGQPDRSGDRAASRPDASSPGQPDDPGASDGCSATPGRRQGAGLAMLLLLALLQRRRGGRR